MQPGTVNAMNKKQALVWTVVVVVLAALVFSEVRTWRHFDWAKLGSQVRDLDFPLVVAAVGLIYLTYILRAVRWKIFLRPVCRTSTTRLIAPTFIGFTGLALLGRPGEFIRPYVIARKEGLSISSQIGVWVVERIFDLGAYAVLAIVDIFLASGLPRHVVEKWGLHADIFVVVRVVLIGMTIGLAAAAYYMRYRGDRVAAWLETRLRRFPRAALHVSAKARALSQGLNTIHDGRSFVQLIGVSLAIWFSITIAYLLVVHSYPNLETLPYSRIMLLVGFSMVGGVVQLPAIGVGSQLATIAGLMFFGVDKELAIGCGILLWLVTFVAVTPTGLVLARREHVSLRKLTQQSHAAEEKEEEEQAAAERVQPRSEI